MKQIDRIKGKDKQLHRSYIWRVLNSTAIAGATKQISRDMGSQQYYLTWLILKKHYTQQMRVFF